MTTWTSSAPITLRERCHWWMPSDTSSTWWSTRTMNPASPNRTTRCAGSVAIRLLPTPPRSSLKSSSVLHRLLWERSSAKEKATIISVSVIIAFSQISNCVCQLVLFSNILTKILQPCEYLCEAELRHSSALSLLSLYNLENKMTIFTC